jgi:hypothetical protein
MIKASAAAILAVVGCAAAGEARGQDVPASLRLQGRPGDWVEYRHVKSVRLTVPDGEVRTRTVIRLRQTVLKAEPDAITYHSRIEDVRFEADPPPPGLPDLSALNGLAFDHTSDRHGRLLRLDLPGQPEDAAGALRAQLQNWLAQLGFPPLPEFPARPGDAWTDSARVSASAALGVTVPWELLETRRVSLEELSVTESGTEAVLRVLSDFEVGPEEAGDPAATPDVRGGGEQLIRFDVSRGRFLGSSGTSELRFPIGSGEDGRPVGATAVGSHRTEVMDSSTEPSARPD